MVSQILAHVDYLDDVITTVSERVATQIAPYAADLTRLDTIPGVNQRTAEVLIAELGVDMRVFPSERHLASWVALCPGQNESAGRQHSQEKRVTGTGGCAPPSQRPPCRPVGRRRPPSRRATID